MINYSVKEGWLTFAVRVVPGASRSEVVGEHNGALRVRVAAAPVDGAANAELIKLLARALQVSRKAVILTAGNRSRLKQISVTGIGPEQLLILGGAKRSSLTSKSSQ